MPNYTTNKSSLNNQPTGRSIARHEARKAGEMFFVWECPKHGKELFYTKSNKCKLCQAGSRKLTEDRLRKRKLSKPRNEQDRVVVVGNGWQA